MSKYAESVDFRESEKSDADKKQDKLRFIEKQFSWVGEPWHFRLVQELDEPIKVYSWFRDVTKIGEKFYFNANTKGGVTAYDWVERNYIGQLLKAFGKVQIILAADGKVIKSFDPYDKPKRNSQIEKIIGAIV